MAQATLSVAHFGHPLLKGAKHWSLLLFNPSSNLPTAYQTTGSTETYTLKPPELVDLSTDNTFMGKVDVGLIDLDKVEEFERVLGGVGVTRGRLDWNCQNWVVEALGKLKESGFGVEAAGQEELGKRLAAVTGETGA